MSFLGPITTLSRGQWDYEIDFTAPDAAEQYGRAGFQCQRPTEGSYWDSNGRLRIAAPFEPRFGYDPITKEPLGLMCELARNNYIYASEKLTLWQGYYNGLPGLKLAPDPSGGNTAWSFKYADLAAHPFVPASGRLGGLVNAGVAEVSPGTICTASIWVKSTKPVLFNFGFSDNTNNSYRATPDWQQFSYCTAYTGEATRKMQIVFSVPTGQDLEPTVSLWHPQFKIGEAYGGPLGSYVPTPDTPAFGVVGSDFHISPRGNPMFPDYYNNQGAFYVEWDRHSRGNNGLFLLSDPGGIEAYSIFADDSGATEVANFLKYWGGTGYSSGGPLRLNERAGVMVPQGIQRMIAAWNYDGVHGSGSAINGQPYTPNGEGFSGLTPNGELWLGSRLYNNALDGYIRKFRVHSLFSPDNHTMWDELIPNSVTALQAQVLTS